MDFGYCPEFCERLNSCLLRNFNRQAASKMIVIVPLIEREAARLDPLDHSSSLMLCSCTRACYLLVTGRASHNIVPGADHARRSPTMLAPRPLRAVLCLPLGGSSREHPYIRYAIPHCPLDLYLSSLSLSCYRYVVQTASLPSKPRMFATSIGEVRCPSHRRESPRPCKVRRFFGAPWGSFCVPESTSSFGIPVRVSIAS